MKLPQYILIKTSGRGAEIIVESKEITSCRECKWYGDSSRKISGNCVRENRTIPMKPDDFCSRGEPR